MNTDKYSGLLLSCDVCETEIITMVRKSLTCFTNILLNDYTTAQSDKVSTTKIAKKYQHFLGVIMQLIYYFYTVYSKLYKCDRVNRILKYIYICPWRVIYFCMYTNVMICIFEMFQEVVVNRL